MKISLFFKIMYLTILTVCLSGMGVWLLAHNVKSATGWLFLLGGALLAVGLPFIFTKPLEKLLAMAEASLTTEQTLSPPGHPTDPLIYRFCHSFNTLLARLGTLRQQTARSEQAVANLGLKSDQAHLQGQEVQLQWQKNWAAKEQEMATYQIGLAQTTQLLQETQEHLKNLQRQQDETNTQTHALTLELQQVKQQEDGLRSEVTTLQQTLQERQQALRALQNENASLTAQLQATREYPEKIQQQQDEINTLTTQINDLTLARQQSEHHLATRQLEISTLQQTLQEQQQVLRALQNENASLTTQLQATREYPEKIQQQQDEINTLTTQINDLTLARQQSEHHLATRQLEISTLQQALLARQKEHLALQSEIISLAKQLHENMANLETIQQQQQEITALNARISTLTAEHHQAMQQQEISQQALANLQAEVNTLTPHLQEVQQTLATTRAQLDHLNNALDQHAIVSVADENGTILHVNSLFCQTSGYQQQELIGKNHNIINSGYHPKAYYQEMWNLLKNGQVWHGEIRNRAKDGTTYWVKGTIVPFPGNDGQPSQFMAIRTDITRQKEAEEQARSMALFARFNPNPMLRVNDGGMVVKANPAANATLNLPAKPTQPLAHYLPAVQNIQWQQCISQNETLHFCTKMQGHYYQFMVQGFAELDAAHIYGVETTQTVEAEKNLRINHHFLLQIATHIGEGVYALDRDGKLTFINQEAQRLLGWRQEELLGKAVHDVIHYQNVRGEPVPHHDCPVLQTMRTGLTHRVMEDVFTHRDGHLIPISFTSSPLLEGRQVVGSVNVFQDITQRKQIDQEVRQARDLALEASRLKSEFLANMSHEIRTPMNGVIGMTDLLLDSKLNKEQRELATTARESAQALLTIINDILDFSKIEAGKLEFDNSEFSPLRVVEGVAELVAPQAQKKNLDIICDISPRVPTTLKGDAGRIRQVLLNLAGNAVKFTKKGEVVLAASQEIRNETHASIRFSVSDTGIGIPKAAHYRLFQPFTQVDGSCSREYGGTGLGLSISSRLVEMMGGEIGFTSKKGKGSTFWFTIPLLLASTTETEREPGLLPSLKGTKVLLIVRNQTSQTILMNHLINWNMRCTAVESSEEAMAILRHDAQNTLPFLLVIVDDSPANQEALELIRTVHHETSLVKTLILLFTANKEEPYLQQAREAGVNSFLFKPLRQGNLLECLANLFQGATSSQEDENKTSQPPLRNREQPTRNILLAEDNPVNQKVSQMQIHRLGYATHTVSNGKDAVEAAMAGTYDLILMDCQMPLMNGFEASQTIRRLETGTNRHIPIIALTANAMKGDRERCLEAGMDDYLSKPVEFRALERILNKWFPGATTSNAPAPVVMASLNALFDGNQEAIREALQSFLGAANLMLVEMIEQFNRQDRPGLRHNVNAIREAGQQLEAEALDELCRQMEIVCSVGDWKQAKLILEKIQLQFQSLEHFIHTLPTM